MNSTMIEFPAYNIFFRQGGSWKLHGEPMIGKPYIEVESFAVGILLGKPLTEAVRIYGIFNCQQTFIKEISNSFFDHKSEEDKMRSAINAAIAICNEMLMKGTYLRDGTSRKFADIKKVLSEAIETTKDVSWREKKGI